jgi:hypothetical protein
MQHKKETSQAIQASEKSINAILLLLDDTNELANKTGQRIIEQGEGIKELHQQSHNLVMETKEAQQQLKKIKQGFFARLLEKIKQFLHLQPKHPKLKVIVSEEHITLHSIELTSEVHQNAHNESDSSHQLILEAMSGALAIGEIDDNEMAIMQKRQEQLNKISGGLSKLEEKASRLGVLLDQQNKALKSISKNVNNASEKIDDSTQVTHNLI